MSTEKDSVLSFISRETGFSKEAVRSALREIVAPDAEPEPEIVIPPPAPVRLLSPEDQADLDRRTRNRRPIISQNAFRKG
jgi:hypothetical protein